MSWMIGHRVSSNATIDTKQGPTPLWWRYLACCLPQRMRLISECDVCGGYLTKPRIRVAVRDLVLWLFQIVLGSRADTTGKCWPIFSFRIWVLNGIASNNTRGNCLFALISDADSPFREGEAEGSNSKPSALTLRQLLQLSFKCAFSDIQDGDGDKNRRTNNYQQEKQDLLPCITVTVRPIPSPAWSELTESTD